MMNCENAEAHRYTFQSLSLANDTTTPSPLQQFQVNSFQNFPVYTNVLPTNYQPMSKFPIHQVPSPTSNQSSPQSSNFRWKIKKANKTHCFRLKPIAFNKSLSNEISLTSSPLSNKCNFPIVQPTQDNAETNSIYPSIEMKKYSTSAISTTRNYLTVYQYEINDQHIRWDYETGLVHLTGMWKASLAASSDPNVANAALSSYNMKADIVKLLESTPKSFQPYIKRIRGGFLKIQGTWLPYSLAKMLARKFCYHIRYKLVPIFGNDFPEHCLKPDEKGFGELKFDQISPGEEINLKESLSHLPKDTGISVEHCHDRQKVRNVGPCRSKSDPNYNFSVSTTSLSTSDSDSQKSLSIAEFPPTGVFPTPRTEEYKEYKPYSNIDVQWTPPFHTPSTNKIRKESLSQCPIESASPKTIMLPLPQKQQQQQQLPLVSSLNLNFNYKAQLPPINTTTPYSPVESIMSNSNRPSRGSRDLTSETSPPITNNNNYEDMMDIVNACKCLQSFRIKNSINYTTKKDLQHETRKLVPLLGITDPRNPDTTTNDTTEADSCTALLPPIVELYATRYSRLSNARHQPKPASLSVNDLLT